MGKQIPFRYPEELEEDIQLIQEQLANSGSTKNKALINAVKIAAGYIKKRLKVKSFESLGHWEKENAIESDLEINLTRYR